MALEFVPACPFCIAKQTKSKKKINVSHWPKCPTCDKPMKGAFEYHGLTCFSPYECMDCSTPLIPHGTGGLEILQLATFKYVGEKPSTTQNVTKRVTKKKSKAVVAK